jgi:SAM-dependent methyltransferase
VRQGFKSLIQATLPPAVVHRIKIIRSDFKQRRARAAFNTPGPAGQHLSAERLIELQSRYPKLNYGYDPHSLLRRGEERAAQIGRLIEVRGARILELAAHDGMVSGVLARAGARAVASALDLRQIDPRAVQFGAETAIADAQELPFEDASFDLVFSYNAFEHFADPEAVVAQALRVTRPGGFVYFNFGPLYRSSYGLHAMHSINVPFCQFLWSRAVLDAYIADRGLRPIEYETMNEWTVQQFRDLWARWQPWASTSLAREVPSVHGIELIEQHAECFRGKVEAFEDLIIAILEVAMRRTDKAMPRPPALELQRPAKPAYL